MPKNVTISPEAAQGMESRLQPVNRSANPTRLNQHTSERISKADLGQQHPERRKVRSAAFTPHPVLRASPLQTKPNALDLRTLMRRKRRAPGMKARSVLQVRVSMVRADLPENSLLGAASNFGFRRSFSGGA